MEVDSTQEKAALALTHNHILFVCEMGCFPVVEGSDVSSADGIMWCH